MENELKSLNFYILADRKKIASCNSFSIFFRSLLLNFGVSTREKFLKPSNTEEISLKMGILC